MLLFLSFSFMLPMPEWARHRICVVIERDYFFNKYNIDKDEFSSAGLDWNDLSAIIGDYDSIKPGLEAVGRYVVDALLKCAKVHSIKYRLKEDEHLLEKIIRKTIADPARTIRCENYREQITDLVGIRALHLFKEDWMAVHEYIQSTWELSERPIAYVRAGDSDKIIEYYRHNDCDVREHRFGYRSVHYLIESKPEREKYIIEIQARTVFEEGWGEIDHVISYPYQQENELLVRLSSVLNRLAANADELGSYMRYLKNKTDLMEREYRDTIEEKNRLISNLQKKIDSLEIDSRQKEEITTGLAELGRNRSSEVEFEEKYPWLENFMESALFKGITERVKKIVNSDDFKDLELSDADVELLANAQKDLVRLIDSPEEVEKILQNHPLKKTLLRLEDGESSGDKDKE
jgi:ppGpp synthetase/RelA/SpoT-type nucleotidyltranferase